MSAYARVASLHTARPTLPPVSDAPAPADAPVLRPHPEQTYARELQVLANADTAPRPPNWRLSPRAVVDYLMGAEVDGETVTPKYIGDRRLMEVAVATLTTQRGLLLAGVPGTAKTWVSEHLAAAICGDSTLLVQGTAGLNEDALRYGWNYASLISKGPSREALVPSPVMEAMRRGSIVRIEELTRIPSEVQDSLITILSEKTLPVPELATEVQAVPGFNLIATANERDRGVNELSTALRRRFNTVTLPAPATLEEEIRIVRSRASVGDAEAVLAKADTVAEIERLVTVFRELRGGKTLEGDQKIQPTSAGLSTAEAISVVENAVSLASHFGDGRPTVRDLAPSLRGAVIRDPERDGAAWRSYVEGVLRQRTGAWRTWYETLTEFGPSQTEA